jgi:hypothetical protein
VREWSPSVKRRVGVKAKPAAVLIWGVTTWLSRMSVVLSGCTPEPGSGSDRVAEMTGQAVVITEPLAGVVSVMSGGWPS